MGGDTSGYPVKRIFGKGEKNKWRAHRILHFLKNPFADPYDTTKELAHLCGRRRFDAANSVVRACINPHHTVVTDDATNFSHNQCANRCAQLCPHSEKCIWTHMEGRRLKCRDKVLLPDACECGLECF